MAVDMKMEIINIDKAIQKFSDMSDVGSSVVGRVWVDNDKMDGEEYPVHQEYGFVHFPTGKYIPPKYYMRGAAGRVKATLDKEIGDYIKRQHRSSRGLNLYSVVSNLVEDTYRYAYMRAPEDTGKLRRSISVETKKL